MTTQVCSTNAWIEAHMRLEPDGNCVYCGRPADQHHPVGPLKVLIGEPDGCGAMSEFAFCEWRCFGAWAATQAGGVFIVDRN
jgi:hypothetical protein